MPTNVFVSCGRASRPEQEAFVVSVERRLAAARLRPLTVGRTVFDYRQPLRVINEVMRSCAGAVVIAYERTFVEEGLDQRGSSNERKLNHVGLTTPWNQIEGAMAYARGLPILMLVDKSVRQEGLVDRLDWLMVPVDVREGVEAVDGFEGIFQSWRTQVQRRALRSGWFPTQRNFSGSSGKAPLASNEIRMQVLSTMSGSPPP